MSDVQRQQSSNLFPRMQYPMLAILIGTSSGILNVAAAALREALCIRPLVTRMPRSARTAEVNAKAATRVAVDEPSSNGALNGIR